MLAKHTEENATSNGLGPKSVALLERRQRFVARGAANTTPIFVREAKGATVTDVDGNRYLDFAGGIGVLNVGHCPEEVVAAITTQASQLIHSCFHVAMYEPYVELAERLATIMPGDFPKKTIFLNSGAEAVENAVKIARKYTERTGIVALECGFHGRTLLTMTLTSKVKPYKYGFGPFAPDVYKIPSAYCYRCYFGLSYPTCGLHCAESLGRFFVTECPADRVAALIAEPVQGEGGFIVPPTEFLPSLQAICAQHGILFIADEIQTGFGRTGSLFACEHYGVVPDLITVAKSLAAGLPLSAVVGRADVMDAPAPGEIGGTYGGNPVSCAAALAVLRTMESGQPMAQANVIGATIMHRLRALQEEFPVIGDVRGLGAMVAMEFVKDRKTKEPATEFTARLVSQCWQQGLIVLSAGIYGNVVRFLVPLVVGDDELNEGLDIMERALRTVVTQQTS